MIKQSVKHCFDASNKEAEYEALIVGLNNSLLMGGKRLQVYYDSKLVINQLKGEHAARNYRTTAYM